MSDCIQLKMCPHLRTNGSIALLFCWQGCVCFVRVQQWLLLFVVLGCLLPFASPAWDATAYVIHMSIAKWLQLQSTVPWQEKAAALTITRMSICHQRETWEAGTVSPACHDRTLLTASTIFWKTQHTSSTITIILGFHSGWLQGHSHTLNSTSLCCCSTVLVINFFSPQGSLKTLSSKPLTYHQSLQEGGSQEPFHSTQQNQFSLFNSSIVLLQRGMAQELFPLYF